MINRLAYSQIQDYFFRKKAILLFGARQVGKTTLIKSIIAANQETSIYLNADESDVRESLTNTTSSQLQLIIGKHTIVIIDEAQNVDNIGLTLKLFVDNFPHIQVIAIGSSSFELANKANEPLTGRKFEMWLFPLSFSEMVTHSSFLEEKRMLEHRLVYGYYPEIVTHIDTTVELLKLLANSYLYKDLLILDQIKRPKLIEQLLKALALQVGNEVSYNELAQTLRADIQTIEKYIEILEQAFIIFKLPAYSKNVRNEIKKGRKIYFFDNGIRNAIIGNYNTIPTRTDVGALWENFVISERYKFNTYTNKNCKSYFWRTTQKQEIDYLEEENNELCTFEFKWNPIKKPSVPKTFSSAYVIKNHSVISPKNIEEFLL